MPDQLNFLDAAEPSSRRGEYPLPSGATVEACRSCGAQIVWLHTERGTSIPLSLATCQTRDGVTYCLSHWSDCPDAKEWRRG
jgi:hypothetical protein